MAVTVFWVYKCDECGRKNYIQDDPFPVGSLEWQSCMYCRTTGRLVFVTREEQQ